MEQIRERKFNRLMRVSFTVAEKVEMSEQAASAYRNLHKAQDDLGTAKAQFQSKIKEHEAEIASLFERINSGWEMRSVGCREIRDYHNGSVYVFRDDTEEVIEERAMTAEERQPELPFKEIEPSATDPEGGVGEPGQPDSLPIPEAPLDLEEGKLPEDTNPFYLGDGKKENQDA